MLSDGFSMLCTPPGQVFALAVPPGSEYHDALMPDCPEPLLLLWEPHALTLP